MKALEVRIRKVRKGDIDRIIDIERSWQHLSHWSIDSYYRLLNDDTFTSSFVAEIDDQDSRSRIVGFVIFHIAADVSEIYNIAVESSHATEGPPPTRLASKFHDAWIKDAVRTRKSASGDTLERRQHGKHFGKIQLKRRGFPVSSHPPVECVRLRDRSAPRSRSSIG